MTEEQLDEEMLRELQRQAAELPREIAPPEGAWKRIAEQIEVDTRLAAPRTRRVFWHSPAFLAAAAVLLVAVSSITTAVVMKDGVETTRANRTVAPPPAQRAPTALAEFTARENDYIATVNALSETIESSHVELAPGTIEKLKESIRVIDEAILEARGALARDPSNRALIEILSTSYDQKVDLLKRTAEMGQS
jgi:hypothetical protein